MAIWRMRGGNDGLKKDIDELRLKSHFIIYWGPLERGVASTNRVGWWVGDGNAREGFP